MIKSYICNLCLHNNYCQHNFDYQCQEVFNHFKVVSQFKRLIKKTNKFRI